MDTEEENVYLTCMRCGKLMPEDAAFCNSCGADLAAAPVRGLQGAVSPADFKGAIEESPAPPAYPAVPLPPGVVSPVLSQQPHPALPATFTPGYYPAVYRQRRSDGMAVFSLVCAIISFTVLPVIPALAAIATGYVSRERIRESDGGLNGGGMAMAGIVLGVVNLALSAMVLLIIVLVVLSL